MTQKSLIFLSMSAVAVAAMADAKTIPLVEEYGARGPMLVCVGNIGIKVGPGEATHVTGSVLRVINDHYFIAAVPSPQPTLTPSGPKPFRLDKEVGAYRFDDVSPDAAKDAPLALGKDDIRYLVSNETGTVLLVGSNLFDGSRRDRAILSRLHGVALDRPDCVRPLDFAPRRADPVAAGFASYAEARENALYPVIPDRGPDYYCTNGIGFAIEPGETLRRPWRPLGPGMSSLLAGDVAIKITEPRDVMTRVDPDHASEHPMSLLHKSQIIFYPSRGVGPPYALPGVRETGSWRVELGWEQNSKFQISFPAGEAAQVGFAFLERLEFVDAADPRCHAAARVITSHKSDAEPRPAKARTKQAPRSFEMPAKHRR